MVEQCNEQSWWDSVMDSGTVMVEKWNSKVVQCGGTVEQSLWNSGTIMVEQWGGTMKQSWWNSDGGTVEQ